MFTKDQLNQLRSVIREEVDIRALQTEIKLEKRTEQLELSLSKRADQLDNRIANIETKFDKRTESLETKLEQLEVKMELHFTTLKQQQDQDRNDWIGFFHEAGVFFDEMRNKLVKRIERIEEHVGISKN